MARHWQKRDEKWAVEPKDTRRLDAAGRLIGGHHPGVRFAEVDSFCRPASRAGLVVSHVGQIDPEDCDFECITFGGSVSVGELPISMDEGRLVAHVQRKGSYVVDPNHMSPRILSA